MTRDAAAFVLFAMVASSCGGTYLQPSAVDPLPPVPPRLHARLTMSGQSNAIRLERFLRPYADALDVSAQDGLSISYWGPTTAPQVMMPALTAILTTDAAAIVWWQGESDRANPNYLEDLRALAMRVRAVQPGLLWVEVRVLDLPINQSVRAAQEIFVATDSRALLISSDGAGFQDGTTDHLTDLGYEAVARRIVDAIHAVNR